MPRRGPGAVAVIPARGGSKGIPGKNLARVGGQPLVARAVQTAQRSRGISHVVVSTDSPDIAVVAEAAGAEVVDRPADIAGDTATSESALLHALSALGPDNVPPVTVLIQCTSPFIPHEALGRGIDLVARDETDVAFSVVPTHAFLWRPDPESWWGINHDKSFRPRRQDREPEFRETGAFYAMRTEGLLKHGHRFFGRVRGVEVPEATALEIDTPNDLALARSLAALLSTKERVDVDALVTDFDGVHTDDTVIVDQDGRESVRVSRSDGMGVARLRDAGVIVMILSKETNSVVTARAQKLGVPVLQGVDDKAAALRQWMHETGLDPDRVAYLGNDVNDLPAMQLVGWPIAVSRSHESVLASARLTLHTSGGRGAIRDLAERIIDAKGATA